MLDKYSEFFQKVLAAWFGKREIYLSLLNMGGIIPQVNALNLGLLTIKEGDYRYNGKSLKRVKINLNMQKFF